MKRKYKNLIIFGSSMVIMFSLLILSLIGAFLFAFFGTIKIDNTDKYLKTDGFLSDFIIFPEKLENIDEIVDYHYIDYQLRDGHEVVLIARYNHINYYKEIQRIENISYQSTSFKSDPKYIMKDFNNVLFNKPTYVTTYIPGRKYEYACIDDSTYTIAYFFIEFMSKERVSVDSEFLPKLYNDENELYSQYCYDIYSLSEYEEYNRWFSYGTSNLARRFISFLQ